MDIFPVVENGYNTCYIDSLLIALFYKNNISINEILENEPKMSEAYYLQELMKLKFVDQIRKNYSIFSQSMNEIRNYSIICGWNTEGNIDEQQNCIKYYNFISDLFKINPIKFELFEFNSNMYPENINNISIPFITLDLNRDNDIRNLFINWLNSNIIKKNSSVIQCYKLINIPEFIVFSINRYDTNDNILKKNNHKIDIMKKIKFFNISDSTQTYIKWKIHSVICHTGKNLREGHYYTILNTNKSNWILFDDYLIPSFKRINMDDENIKDKIMSECVIVIYTLD